MRLLDTPQRLSFFASIKAGYALMSSKEKRRAVYLTFCMMIQGFLDTIPLIAVLPIISLVIQPETLTTNKYLAMLHTAVGSPSPLVFVNSMSVIVLLLMVLGAAADCTMSYLLNHYVAACQNRVSAEVLDECIHAPYSWYLTRNYATITRLLYDDVVMWSRGYIQRIMMILNNFILCVMTIAVVVALGSGTGIAASAVIGILAYAGFRFTKPILSRLAIQKRNALDNTMLAATQALSGIKDVKLSSREGYFINEFQTSYAVTSETHASLVVWQMLPPTILSFLGQAGLIIIVLLFWNTGKTSAEIATQLAILYLITTKIVPAISSLSSSIGPLLAAFPYIDGIYDLRASIRESMKQEQREDESKKPLVDSWQRLSMNQVSFCYPNSPTPAIDSMTMHLKRGQSYGLVGKSAAGKTTTVDLLVGLLRPTKGEVTIDDRSLSRFNLKNWQHKIGYVPQAPYIGDQSLRANVAFGIDPKTVDEEKVLQCLRWAHLGDLVNELEQGLDTRLGDRGLRLSGGQRQRIAIARALYNQPEILIFDEATSALDSLSEAEILNVLDSLHGKMTLIIIAHRLTTVAHCDELFILDEGKIVGQGSYESLKANHVLFQKMIAGFTPDALRASIPT